MKVLFLDIDGVLNSRQYFVSVKGINLTVDHRIDPAAVNRLNLITDTTKCKIVISSSWRLGYFSNLGGLVRILKNNNMTGDVIDMTPCPEHMSLYRPRWKEIRLWLHDNKEVTSFVILDDIQDMGPYKKSHVKTNPEFGLTDLDVERAIKILSHEYPSKNSIRLS